MDAKRMALALALCAGCAGSAPPAPPPLFLYCVDGESEEGTEEQVVFSARPDGSIRCLSGLGHLYAMRPTPFRTVLGLASEDGRPPQAFVEFDAEGRVPWRLDWPPGRAGITHMRAPSALAGDRLLVSGLLGERGEDGRFEGAVIVEIDRDGREIRQIRLGSLSFLGSVRPLADGVLVAGEGVFEISWDGARREVLPPGRLCRDALRLPDGGLLVGEVEGKVARLDAAGHGVWSVPHALPVALQPLPRGGVLAAG